MNDFQEEERKTIPIFEKPNIKFLGDIKGGGSNIFFGNNDKNFTQHYNIFDKKNFIRNIIIQNNDDENEDKEFNNNKEFDEKKNKLILKYKSQLNEKYIGKRIITLKISEKEDNSYFISLFYCLGNLHDLLLYLQKNINKIKNVEKFPFSFSFFRIIEQQYNNNDLKSNPNSDILSFIKVVEYFYPLFKTNKNPIDLFNILMNNIHNELNEIHKNNFFFEKKIDKKNLNELIDDKINFNKNNDSIITKYFTLFCKKDIKCIKCKNIYYEIQNFISFDLDPINTYKKYKKKNLTINDCLSYYISPINEKIICSICNKFCRLSIQKKLFSPPSNLVLVINRNNQNEEREILGINIKYEEFLDISFFIDKKTIDFKVEYILIGVEAFLKNKNKFVSFCKNIFGNNEWVCFDDESINECNYDDMVKNSSPYMLFYKKIE